MVTYCSVPQCKSRNEAGVSFHFYPKSSKMKKAWMIKLKMGKQPSASAVVCSKYFKEEDFVYPVYKTLGDRGVPARSFQLCTHMDALETHENGTGSESSTAVPMESAARSDEEVVHMECDAVPTQSLDHHAASSEDSLDHHAASSEGTDQFRFSHAAVFLHCLYFFFQRLPCRCRSFAKMLEYK
ncbi:uncharacterized protein LOC144094082 [Amblyomma americanum]